MGKSVLVVGSGAREHALVWAIKNKSLDVDEIYCAPGNAGISFDCTCLSISPLDIERLVSFAKEKGIDLTIVGPEAPLVAGIVDAFRKEGLVICGPTKDAAKLEGSKVWTKNLLKKYNIPTADFSVFDDYNKAKEFVSSTNAYPLVIKADGLAAGKGVIIAEDNLQAMQALEDIMINRKFGDAGNQIVIEEFLQGQEASVIVLTDGEFVLSFPSSQDHKRVFDGDRGPNTGGMGAYSNAPVIDYAVSQRVEKEIIFPLIEGLKREGIDYKGVIYAGLMITEGGPKVLEFNVRFGDPEFQAIIPRFVGDFYGVMYACATGGLNRESVNWDSRQCVCVVLASSGYPGSYEKGKIISGIDDACSMDDVIVFHAGTSLNEDGQIVTSGGRVLNVVAMGKSLEEAKRLCYSAVEKIDFEGMHYRRDIADKGINYLRSVKSAG